ncbi:unnamed protein product, partial [Porites evermanni]
MNHQVLNDDVIKLKKETPHEVAGKRIDCLQHLSSGMMSSQPRLLSSN